MIRRTAAIALGLALGVGVPACRDVSRFTNTGDHYEGDIVAGSFVRAGFDAGTRVCLVLDANHLQDAPGTLSSSDGRFHAAPLKPIPQIWHDPLSTLSFGDGRVQNLLYIATPMIDGSADTDVTVIVSLMQGGGVEVRMLRGAPPVGATDEGASLFGVFSLQRAGGSCSF
jgi:hypothetical protein